jgi:hypothetical protein
MRRTIVIPVLSSRQSSGVTPGIALVLGASFLLATATSIVLPPPAFATDASAGAGSAVESAPEAAHRAARQTIINRMQEASGEDTRLGIVVELAFLDPDADPLVRAEAQTIIREFNIRKVSDQLLTSMPRMPVQGFLDALDTLDWVIPNLKGVDYRLNATVGNAVGHPDPRVRTKACELVVRYKIFDSYFPLRKRCNQSTGADRLEAIRTMGNLGDIRSAWFLPALIDSKEPGVPQAVFDALAQLGRGGTLAIKERLTDPIPAIRLMAIKALMPLAVIDDLPPLYAFVQNNPGIDDSLKSDLFSTIAKLEVIRDQGFEAPKH